MLAGNGALYGGQIKLLRKADNTDEMLDALVFTEAGYKLVLDSVKGIATGAIDAGNSSVKYLQSKSFRVVCDREVPVEVDGEIILSAPRITRHYLQAYTLPPPRGHPHR